MLHGGRARLLLSAAITIALAAGRWTRPADGARILAVQTIGGKSHWNFMSGVIRALVAGGHHVTAFTPFPDDHLRHYGGGNYTEVDLSAEIPHVLGADLEEMVRDWGNVFTTIYKIVPMSRQSCRAIFEHAEMKRLLRSSDVDAVLIEPLASDCVSYAANRLRVPLIYIWSLSITGFIERLSTGHYSNPAIVSNLMADHGLPRTFVQRVGNAALFVYCEIVCVYRNQMLKWTEPEEFDSFAPVLPSLVFVNGNFAARSPSPIPTEVVEIGGIHLKPANDLPQDLLKFIEQSPHGVIIFTFGSTVKMSTLPEHLRKAFIEALAQIPQRVLLKYENDFAEKPKNVMTMKWFPQRDVLLHPNVKLFISHGGISGLYEAVDAGVPVLGFPVFGDQPRNIDTLVNNGMAISMDLFSLTKDTFLNNILELLNNEKYMKNAKTVSKLFKDRPMSPKEQVVYWTEYVIRHKGAPHLKSHAHNLTWYQYYLLDVIAVVLISAFVVVFIIYKCIKSICKYVFNLLRKVKAKSE